LKARSKLTIERADNFSKAAWSLGWLSAIDSNGRTICKEHGKNEEQEATIAHQQKQIEALAAGLQKTRAHKLKRTNLRRKWVPNKAVVHN